jgi:hypothetical protein
MIADIGTSFPLHPYQEKMLADLRAMGGKAVFHIPNQAGKASVVKRLHGHSIRDQSMKNAYYSMYGRQHKKKRWMSETYHKRIQKKWNKRYGLGIVNSRAKVDLSKSIEQILKTAPGEKFYKTGYGSSLEEFQSQSRIFRTCIRKPVEIIEFTPELLEKLKPNFTSNVNLKEQNDKEQK